MTTTLEPRTTLRPAPRVRSRASAVRHFVGGFYLVMGGINAGIVAGDPQTYRPFADAAYWSFVTDAWHSVVMARPTVWFLLLAAGEVTLGLLLLRGGPPAKAGWVGVIAFHVLLMSFGFGIWMWSLPALALLVPAAVADWPALTGPGARTPAPNASDAPRVPVSGRAGEPRSRTVLWTTSALSVLVVAASLFGLLAQAPYRSLPEATIVSARAQDACSIVVAVLLLLLVRHPVVSTAAHLTRLGLLAYLLYSYLIYVTGVPMNRVFLVYVAIVCLSGAGLLSGLRGLLDAPPASSAGPRLTRSTGWVLVVTAVLFASLWLSVLLPFALGGDRPDPEGVGGLPYPVFVLDLSVVLPAIAAVGVLLLRGRPVAAPMAAVALLKILTLFTALWAGPVLALVTGAEMHLGPDAGPSLLLLLASAWLSASWLRSFHPSTHPTNDDTENERRSP
ncbi:MAG TPA: hypothetical protein VGD39_09050 [Nocardioides sp.]